MTPTSITLVGGLLMGLASSLHCAGMCGGIATSLMFTFDSDGGQAARVRALFAAQLGRIAMYVAGGAFLGAVGATFYGAFDHAGAYLVLRSVAAVALGWIGFSMTGFAPSLAGVDRLTAPIAGLVRLASGATDAHGGVGAFMSGLLWGLLPCGMVYGALFYAMLAGSAAGGASVMIGFGLGTAPAVTAVALGMSWFRQIAKIAKLQLAVGLAIMALAVASIAIPAAASGALCFP